MTGNQQGQTTYAAGQTGIPVFLHWGFMTYLQRNMSILSSVPE